MPAVFRAYPAPVIRNSDYRQRTGNNALGMPPPPLHARCGSHEHSQQLIAALADMAQAGEPLPSLIYVNVTYPLALTLWSAARGGSITFRFAAR